jgi:hypothetical protein
MHSSLRPFLKPMIFARNERVWWGWMTAALLAAGFGLPAIAQDAVPESPPELKDFRLDKPPPREKAPEAPPPVTPAPAPQPTIETPRAETPAPQRPKPKAEPVAAPKAQTEETAAPTTEPVADSPAASEPALTPGPLVAPDAAPPATAAEPVASNPYPDIMQYWPIGLALLSALLGFAAFRLWRGRAKPLEADDEPAWLAAEVEPQADAHTPRPMTPTPIRPAPAKITASFDPSDARLSIANLTITGRLRVRYDGKKPLESLKLRNMVISACDGQKDIIDAFHANPAVGDVESLGPVAPGEEIDLTLELQVPREALQAFDWRERRFVAPIVLINLGSDDGSTAAYQISCVVGQEGDPLSPRMQPIPIDRGPKRFEALRFRPIAA